MDERQAVELFHLHLVRLLCSGADKDRFAVKGGCNLRFFFESVRYSEDIDLDVARIPVHALKERVNGILERPPLNSALRSRGILVAETSAPKQTETTQRWKVGLRIEGQPLAIHTKVEFSRRPATEEAVVEAIAPSVLEEYRLMAFLAPHYPLDAAIRQKIGALVGRSTVQARDVFDLAVLFARAGAKPNLRPVKAQLGPAIERAMDVSYGDYKAQVVSYLKPEHIDTYASREAWDALQTRVIEVLEGAG